MTTVTKPTDGMRRIESEHSGAVTTLYRVYFRTGEGFLIPRFGHLTVEAVDQQDALGKFTDEHEDVELIGIERLKRGSIMGKMEILEACGLL